MKWRVYAVGSPKLAYARDGIDFYSRRLRGEGRFALCELREKRREAWERRFLEASAGGLRMLLDERGRQWTSRELADWVEDCRNRAVEEVHLLVGASDGHSPRLREEVSRQWALGRLTLQHELALVVLLEQIYRAHSILRGDPYHRD